MWWLRLAQSKGYARLGASLPENGNRARVFKELDHAQNPPHTHTHTHKKSGNFSRAVVSLLDLLTFEDGADRLFKNVSSKLPLYAA